MKRIGNPCQECYFLCLCLLRLFLFNPLPRRFRSSLDCPHFASGSYDDDWGISGNVGIAWID